MLSHIRRVDIEFHSYCNRRCRWCPNIELERDGEDISMSDELYSRILEDLCKNNFGNSNHIKDSTYVSLVDKAKLDSAFAFLGYQEPFTNPILFKKRVNEAYEKLPFNVRIIANSNGDFLSKENLYELMLTTLDIMDYDNKGMEYWIDKLKSLDIMVVDVDNDAQIVTGIHRYVGTVRVRCNWTLNWTIEDKAGFFKQGDLPDMKWKNDMKKRDFVCYEPSYNLTIGYDGSVMPCCHMRSDNPEHQKYILGNLNKKSLIEIYRSSEFLSFRERMMDLRTEFPDTCTYCQKVRTENFIR